MGLLMKNRTMTYIGFVVVLVLAIVGSAVAAFADGGGPATVGVTGTSLNEKDNFSSFASSLSATLKGSDQTISNPLTFTVTDARGTGDGWSLQVTGTPFTCTASPSGSGGCADHGGSHNLPINAAYFELKSEACQTSTGCALPGHTTHSVTSNTPIVLGGNSAQYLYSADVNSGMGAFSVGAEYDVFIPGNTYAGTYQSTVTIALAQTP